ncbi:hypothetical protein QQF64_034582 [Cirrhinus molitorella]|uniref:Nuclease HARBI1 n=1 Tax=Cirrhinus molitorella TaxID=172907 RepID=A0ABR3L4D7_9TELE
MQRYRRHLVHRRRRYLSFIQILMAYTQQEVSRLLRYTGLNRSMPVLQIYFDAERDMRPDYRLRRKSVSNLIQILLNMNPHNHGWGKHLEVLIFIYWLAHALSYRVTSRTFSIPKSTVCRVVHKIACEIKNAVAAGWVICYPRPDQLHAIGLGFAQLARHTAFQKAVGAIDGCHIRIKPPGRNKEDYFNYKQFYSIQMQAV